MESATAPTVTREQAMPGVSAEICANLWYVIDDMGLIYSLRAKLFVCEGTEDEKKAFLLSRAYRDYLVARPFPIPNRFGTTVVSPEGGGTKLPVALHDEVERTVGLDQMFFDCLDEMQKALPAQTRLAIPEDPLIRITALTIHAVSGDVVPLDAVR